MELIKRDLFGEIKNHLESKEISMIVGPRQIGKTTLMEELKKDLETGDARTLWLNLDYETDKVFFTSQTDLLKKLELEFGRNNGFVFIDEIQRKENAGLFLKGLYDMNLPYKLIVSGSGSLELKEKIHESLTGRKRIFELNPVGFSEFVDYKTNYKYSNRLEDFFSVQKDESLNLLVEYLNFGGYPRIILEPTLSEKNKLMNEIFRSYLEKDVAYLLKVERVDAFTQLIKLLANQTGRIVNYSEIAKQIGISVPTLKNYLWYAEKTFIIRMISPYFSNKGKEIIKAPVVYFYDTGLRNFSLNLFGNLQQPNQLGFVFQNFIANRLVEKLWFSGQSLHFWRTTDQAEVDFVLNRGSDIMPIEVKYAALKKPEISRSFRNFLEKYKPSEAMIVNLNLETEIKVNGTKIKFLPFHQL
jgi:hypothetical protein